MDKSLTLAVLSGKGGTGKTLLCVNLSAVAEECLYIDCDVEEPNGHLFLKPQLLAQQTVSVLLPVYDASRCSGCRTCVDFCQYHALAYLGGQVKIFPSICHSCGGCVLLCPQKALTETSRPIGHIDAGVSQNIQSLSGFLDPGETTGTPLIQEMMRLRQARKEKLVFIDCPPGSACNVMDSIQEADYCLLVAEPTLFGADNLAMVHQLVELFKKPYGVVLNKYVPQNNPSEQYCRENHLPVLGRIPYDVQLGRLHAEGQVAARHNQEYRALFSNLLQEIQKEASLS